MKLSILTATYNRGEYLKTLYKSIINNLLDELNIEWLIMDDGSNDNTQEIVSTFNSFKNLEIKYIKQKNQGKMNAINNLMEHVTGELVMDCDSDDYFSDNAFKNIFQKSHNLLEDDSLYGLIFLKNENKVKISGNKFQNEGIKTTMFDMYFKNNITGEKQIVFRTDIRKKYKHELVDNEKFITEARMYHKMDLDYYVKCFNDVIIEFEYLESGYTSNINKTFHENPKGYFEYFKEILQRKMKGTTWNKRIYAIKHYILFEYLSGNKMNVKNIKSLINKIIYLLCFVPGRIYSKIKFKKDDE